MPAEKADATKGAGEAIYKGFAKYNSAVDIINAIETKIAGIESGATADQTGTEIKALLEALVTKLSIETGVGETANKKIMTAAERTNIVANAADIVTAQADIITAQAAADAAQADIDGFPNELKNLITHEIQQIENMPDDLDISAAQWGMLGAGVEWTAWTPNLTGGADLSGYDTARYFRIGDICYFYFAAEGKNVTTGPDRIQITLPFSMANTGRLMVTGTIYDGASWVIPYIIIEPNTDYVRVYKTLALGTWAGDETAVNIRVSGFFEIA